MDRAKAVLGLLLVATVALSGCTAENSVDGQSASAGGEGHASLSFNGYGSGTKSAGAGCDDDGSVSVSANLGSGSLTVTVTDGSGATAYQESISGPDQKSSSDPVDDVAGGERGGGVDAPRRAGVGLFGAIRHQPDVLTRTLAAGLSVFALSLAGCTDSDALRGEEVSLGPGQVPVDDSATRSLSCGEKARITVEMGGGDGGRLTVTVRDGGAVPVYSEEFPGGSGGDEADLFGSAGTWTVAVHRTKELDSAFTVTLTC